MISITNRNYTKKDEHTFYCGRGSPVGNPFKINDYGSQVERDNVINKYKDWLMSKIDKNDKSILSYLNKMIDHYKKHEILKLECYCYPKKCHCEILRDIIEGVNSS